MNNGSIAKNNMYKKVKTFFNNHYALFNGFTRLLTQITLFLSLNDKLDGYIKEQSKVITGIASGKAAALAALVANTVKVSRKLLVYAKDKGNTELATLFDVRDYDFINQAYAAALSQVENILDSMKGISDPLTDYRVSTADITAIETGLTACKAMQGSPGDAQSGKEAATKAIATTMKDIDECLAVLDDLIENEYEESHPDALEQYHKDRRIDTTGVRHSGIHALISNGALAEGVTMTVDELAKTTVSDINGMAEISPMIPGTYHVTFAGAGYTPQTLKLTVTKGKMLQVSVEIAKA